MKKPIAAAIFIIFNLFFINTQAQVKLAPAQVKEILVQNRDGGMGYGYNVDVKVIAEAGQWRSYLSRKTSYSNRPEPRSYDSTLHKFITVLDPALINDLLNGIAVIKPTITPSTFKIASQGMIAELKSNAEPPITNAPDLEKLITQKAVDDAITHAVIDYGLVDTFEDSEVDIVTRDNDTVKLTTGVVTPTKQPWALNGHATYDMAINNFVLAAIGNQYAPNKESLNITSLKEYIYRYIDAYKADGPIVTFKWTHYYPENLKLLAGNFKIKKISLYQGEVYSCLLKTKIMPANAFLESTINMTHSSDIKAVIEYAALIDQYFKGNNFVLNYYRHRHGSSIHFFYDTAIPIYGSLRYVKQKLPELAKVDSTQVINAWIGSPGESSTWMLFPDNKALLTNHTVTKPQGKTAPFYPPKDPNAGVYAQWHTYYFFNAGKLINQGIGF